MSVLLLSDSPLFVYIRTVRIYTYSLGQSYHIQASPSCRMAIDKFVLGKSKHGATVLS